MFSKAKIKRFNEEVGCAPAPNHYDSKLPTTKKTGHALVKSARFEETKNSGPGPGQYLTVQDGFARPSPQGLQRSASFRFSSAKRGSAADLSRNDVFKTPCSTPRRLRRSISQGDLDSPTPSPLLRRSPLLRGDEEEEETEVKSLKARITELELQLKDAMEKLMEKEGTTVAQGAKEEEMKQRIEQLEAEMETLKTELKLREEEREESEKLAEQLDTLKLQSDYAFTLKSENELLNQDILTLEEELTKSKEERDKIEEELEEMRKIRKDLDAKNVFLHFTQEQLNAQVVSLENVVKNLKTENHLLNKGIKNIVEQVETEKKKVQSEKKKFEELSEQYNTDNREAEVAFQKLSEEVEETKARSKTTEIELRAKLGEAEVEKAELKKDLEVSENDKTVLKDQLKLAEEATKNITLDLAEVSRQKSELENLKKDFSSEIEKLQELNNTTVNDLTELTKEKSEVESKYEELSKEMENVKNDLEEIEMSKVGLEGANAALGEEMSQLVNNHSQVKSRLLELETQKERLTEELSDLKISKQEIEESLLDYQGLVEDMDGKLIEAHANHRTEAADLAEKAKKANAALEEVQEERSNLLEMNTALSGQVAELLQTIHNIQDREDTMQQELILVKQFMEAAQEEGEEERVRMIQMEDELLSLQAELEDTLVRLDEAVRQNEMLRSSEAHNHRETRAMREDFAAQQDTLKSAYNSAVTELHQAKTTGRQLLDQITTLEEEVAAKKLENSKILKDFEDRNEESLKEMDKMVHGFEQEKSLLHDQVKHLENLRDNLEKTVSAKTEKLYAFRSQVEVSAKAIEASQQKIEEVNKTNLRLKGNLELRATENLKLKDQIETIKKEVEVLNLSNATQNTTIQELTAQKDDLDRLRNSDMEMCLALREKLAKAEEDVEKGESAIRSMEAQQAVVMQVEANLEEEKVKSEEYLSIVRKYKERQDEMEDLMKQMDQRNDQLEEHAQASAEQYHALEQMVEPFKEQLESFELEKNALLSRTEASKEEMNKLASDYSSLLGHQNNKQKIKHVVKLKQENISLKTDLDKIKLELQKSQKNAAKWEQKYQEVSGQRRFDPRLSFQPQPRNKENLVTPVAAVKETRKSTGSPLARVNRK